MTPTRHTFRTRRTRYTGVAVGVVALALTATACGSDDSFSNSSNSSGSDKTVGATAAAGDSSPSEAVRTTFTSYASTQSFSDTEKALKKAVSGSGMMVLGDLNQAGALKSTGLSLKGAHAYFVGNPAKEKMFFQQNPAIGAVIPLRMYVWADDDGTAHVGYYDPAPLFTAIDSKLADGGEQMKMAAEKIADGAAK